jgi:hypothetical protein
MNVRTRVRKRAEQARHRALSRCLVDDEASGLWPAKRAYQARSRALVQTGQRAQETMLLIAPEVVRGSTFRRRSDEF